MSTDSIRDRILDATVELLRRHGPGKTGVVTPAVVAHGKMSDPDYTGYATKFSNVEGSNMSSLGFVLTGATYTGEAAY